jgi:RND family efflux transporter MFP subunit
MKFNKILPFCIVGALCTTFISGCNEEKQQAAGAMLLPVKFAPVLTKDVPIELTLIGRTNALKEAEVRPQVSGIILKRLFTEGSEVKKGQQLYQIDPATYEANLAAAKADLAKAEASEYSAKLRAQRYQELLKTKAVSQQDFDDAQANYKSASAQILSAKAAVKMAEINLAYTRVYAPISGIIGKSVFTEGALVTQNQATALATIQQIDPIYLDLGESVNDLLLSKSEIAKGQIHLNEDNKIEVSLLFENGQEYPEKGVLGFTGVAVDQSTGMVTIRATVPNPNQVLLPGMFMRAQLPKGIKKDALLIPQNSVTRANRSDKYVFVIDKDNTIQQKFVQIGAEIPNYFIIDSGIDKNDRIVISNLQKIKVGMKVQPISETTAGDESQSSSTTANNSDAKKDKN